ncbi:hypothetical protein [Xenorhabdus kozodoii]|uniref:Periplasmic protein n=1 Tax=Xenorhabdus kozodoii TaxID=351676 RepID=A0A2D0LDA1_9GAMM|nr:hypothetical protein [Xenorhabdus kozodoii]PHM73676.1 hypothetical protein Xkoz_01497 [Xenorhabdus kozodoii]
MKIKGTYCLFLILSVWFSNALAFDFSYKNEIPADNKPSKEYLQKRNNLEHRWNMEEMAKDNALAEKREKELKEYDGRFESLGAHHDWYNKQPFNTYSYIQQIQSMQQQHFDQDLQRFRNQTKHIRGIN